MKFFWDKEKAEPTGKSPKLQQPEVADSELKLIPLIAEYVDSKHSDYVNAIESALKNPNIRNIALSGSYGVGKSSILQKVSENNTKSVVELSLSTLAPIEETDLESAIPKQATTATNRIQQEIVKQLLYRERPQKTPDSRFQRIERFIWYKEIVFSCVVGFIISIIFLLAGWTEKIKKEFIPLDSNLSIIDDYPSIKTFLNTIPWDHILLWIVALTIVITLRRILYGRLSISQISAGSAAITLDDKSPTYFDQYLDEIIYFFEVSNKSIVIIEDIDRFEDSFIFDTLRSLNALLNCAPQISNKVRFIYAVKDSIFDKTVIDKRQVEKHEKKDVLQREDYFSKRTKFFDVIIPVVPFVTHRNAKDVVFQVLDEIDNSIDPNLIDLAARYIPDMRTIKNVCNEFIVFRKRIFSGSGESLKLTESELFAMMLYKCTNLLDFEKIHSNNSCLDLLYQLSRDICNINIRNLDQEIRRTKIRLKKVNEIPSRIKEIGVRLTDLIDRTMEAAGYQNNQEVFTFKSKKLTRSDLQSFEFWRDFVEGDSSEALHWANRYSPDMKLRFTKSNIENSLNVSLNKDYWGRQYRQDLEACLVEYNYSLHVLRSADMADLMSNEKYKIKHEEKEMSFDDIVRLYFDQGLSYQLIRSGYINRNFTLYTSLFHGDRVSAAATNFIIHNIENNVMDEYFVLTEDDVDSIIRECGQSYLKESTLYNVAILDRLIDSNLDAADIMLESLVRFGDNEKRFLDAYLSSSSKRQLFIKRFVQKTDESLVYLVGQVELDESERISIINDALESLSEDIEYRVDSKVSSFLETKYSELAIMKSEDANSRIASMLSTLFYRSEVLVVSLSVLSEAVRNEFVEKNLYKINKDNLLIVLGAHSNLSLSGIKSSDLRVYRHVLKNVYDYLKHITKEVVTVDDAEAFIEIIKDIMESNSSFLDRLIEGSASFCVVDDISDVPEDAWPVLAKYQRIEPTFKNVCQYIDLVGKVDYKIAKKLIVSEKILKSEMASESEKYNLAIALLDASDVIHSSQHRVKLVASLDLNNYLDVDDVPLVKGELFSSLLKEDVIEDSLETYRKLLGTDWSTRELFIMNSKNFRSYVTPSIIEGDLSNIFRSDKVGYDVKVSLLENFDEYMDDCDKHDKNVVAEFSVNNNFTLTKSVVLDFAKSGVNVLDVVSLLSAIIANITKEDLCDILRSVGGEYSMLASVGLNKPKVDDTKENRILLDKLKVFGIVSKYVSEHNMLRVFKRHK